MCASDTYSLAALPAAFWRGTGYCQDNALNTCARVYLAYRCRFTNVTKEVDVSEWRGTVCEAPAARGMSRSMKHVHGMCMFARIFCNCCRLCSWQPVCCFPAVTIAACSIQAASRQGPAALSTCTGHWCTPPAPLCTHTCPTLSPCHCRAAGLGKDYGYIKDQRNADPMVKVYGPYKGVRQQPSHCRQSSTPNNWTAFCLCVSLRQAYVLALPR
jgi:hypothetical protein